MSDAEGLTKLDSICMVLIAAGEELKKATGGEILARDPEVEWRGAMGMRDILAHGYLGVDPEQVYNACLEEVPVMLATLRRILCDLQPGRDG